MNSERYFSNKVVICIVLAILSAFLGMSTAYAQDKQPVKTEKVNDRITRLIYADGTEDWQLDGNTKLQFVPSPAQARKEPKPGKTDVARGYITFSHEGRGGVLPEYIPAASEITNKVSIFASPGEFEPATFAIRPLKNLGTVKFSCSDFMGPGGARISRSNVDVYIVEPTVERIGLMGPEAGKCRWVAKWLRPDNTAKAAIGKNVQVYVDVNVPDNAKPGVYTGKVAIKPDAGKASSFAVQLEVLPLKLARSMPWGFFIYEWPKPEESTEQMLWSLKEQRRAGMTQCVISPGWSHFSMPVSKDGVADLAAWDQCIDLYQKAGFENPPVLAFEGLMHGIASAMGKTEDLKFTENSGMSIPGVKAEDVPTDVREFAKQVVRRVYDHSLEAKWPNFYAYFSDEPAGGGSTEKVKFMGGVAREVAPEMQTAETIYTHTWWKPMSGLVDLNIAHYVHPCNNADANRRWREFQKEMGTSKLYGIDFVGPLDTFWDGRQITLTAEKGIDGMLCWVQWIVPDWFLGDPVQPSFDPYVFLFNSWKGGPWCMREKDGRVWRSLAWIGVREGVDDSRYVRTLRKAIEDAEKAGNEAKARSAKLRLQAVMDGVPWVPEVRVSNSKWNSARADAARGRLADAAIECSKAEKIVGSGGNR